MNLTEEENITEENLIDTGFADTSLFLGTGLNKLVL